MRPPLVATAKAATIAAAALSRCDVIRCQAHRLDDGQIHRLDDGLYYNAAFGAHNIWEVSIDEELVDEAAQIFTEGDPFAALLEPGEPYVDLSTPCGLKFFGHRVSWDSDISWISTDDEWSYRRFESIFHRMGLPEAFAPVVPHGSQLRLYNAFFVCRTKCETHDFHCDYFADVGTHALTLITPLRNYRERDSFQLSYKPRAERAFLEEAAAEVQAEGETPRAIHRTGRGWSSLARASTIRRSRAQGAMASRTSTSASPLAPTTRRHGRASRGPSARSRAS